MTADLSPSSFLLTFFLACILRGVRLSCTTFSNTARAIMLGPRMRNFLFITFFDNTASGAV